MRTALWPDCSPHEHAREMAAILPAAAGGCGPAEGTAALDAAGAGLPQAVLVAERATGGLGGFIELGLRQYADGCDSRPVGYVEGWYVDPDLRQQGVGAALVRAGEEWARAQGCTEMASDCLLDNEGSLRAHLALGYEEAERLIHFRKAL